MGIDSIKQFITNNKFLIFTIIMGLLFIGVDNSYFVVIVILSCVISIWIDKVGHIMQYLSLNRLTKSLELANLKLKKSEKIFRDFFTQTNIPMCIFDMNSMKFIRVNKFLCELWHYNTFKQ